MKRVLSHPLLAVLFTCGALANLAHAADKAPAASPAPAASATPAEKPLELKDPVAVVNGEKISRAKLQEAFDNAIKMSGMDANSLTNDQKLAGYHKLLDDLITETLIKSKAAAAKITVTDADVDAEIAKIKKNFPSEDAFKDQLKQAGQTEEKLKVLIKDGLGQRKWIESQIGDKTEVTDADTKKFYDENKQEFEQPEQVRASHILFLVPDGAPEAEAKKKEDAAKAAYDRAKKGEDFTALAKELTEEPNGKESGGDLNFFSKEQMVPEFATAAFDTKVGEITGPVKTQFGYHVIKVTDKKAAGTVPYDQVKPQLTSYMKSQKQQTAVQDVITKLREGAKVENNLPAMKAPEAADASAPGADAAPAATAAPTAPKSN